MSGVSRRLRRLIPGVARRDRGVGLVFAVLFYAYGAVMLVRLPALSAMWRGDPASAALLIAGWIIIYVASLGPGSGAARPGGWARGLARSFRANRLAAVGLVVFLAMLWVGLLAPLLAPGDPAAVVDPAETQYLAPSPAHPMGTDKLGRDVWTRVVHGTRVSLGIGILAVLLASAIGTTVGAATGMAGRRTDGAVMRVVDGLLAFPRILFVLTLVALFPNSYFLLIVAIAATGWMGIARLVRGEVLRLREREFVQAAVASGAGRGRLIVRHLLPNALGAVLITATIEVGGVILLESSLSFLGLGVQPPTPSWGAMVYEGRDVLLGAWWVAAFPAMAIVIVVTACNFMGDGLRDSLDSRRSA